MAVAVGRLCAKRIPEKLMPTSERRLVLALRQGSGEDEVPLDVVLLKAGGKAPMLMLPPGPNAYTSTTSRCRLHRRDDRAYTVCDQGTSILGR